MPDATPQHLFSVPHLASVFNLGYGVVQSAIADLGLPPAVTLDGVGYFDAEAHDRLRCHLADRGAIELMRIELPPAPVEIKS